MSGQQPADKLNRLMLMSACVISLVHEKVGLGVVCISLSMEISWIECSVSVIDLSCKVSSFMTTL